MKKLSIIILGYLAIAIVTIRAMEKKEDPCRFWIPLFQEAVEHNEFHQDDQKISVDLLKPLLLRTGCAFIRGTIPASKKNLYKKAGAQVKTALINGFLEVFPILQPFVGECQYEYTFIITANKPYKSPFSPFEDPF